MRRLSIAALAASLLWLQPTMAQETGVSAEVVTPQESSPQDAAEREARKLAPRIQMAILLDTSGSMSGLIDQARTQLWNIVNEFATTEQDGRRPRFELALYEYGKSSLPAAEGYMRQILPFTDNLDRVSEELFKLTTNGGSEHCGQVIDLATRQLKWSSSSNDLKCIFIAGNEPFTQGPVDYRQACRNAIERGVVINTIHCGDRLAGINGKWGDGALLADGSFTSIDHNAKVAIAAPQDKELIRLSAEVNKTYVAFGSAGWRAENTARQVAQDTNALNSSSAAAASRAVAKCQSFYCPSDWDLVDALKEGKVKLADIKADQLPEAMRKMNLKQREAHLKKLSEKRAKLRKQVTELGKQRDKYVAAELKKLKDKGQRVLDDAIIEAARKQASKKGFRKAESGASE